MKWQHFYIIRLQYLGFRYHGWQKQEGLKTVHGMVDKTMQFALGHDTFKTLGCGRTDAMVSADDFAFELFLMDEINQEEFLKVFNKNLPPDIRATKIEPTNASFNIIQHSKVKTYHYSFSFGEKTHPANAPFVYAFEEVLDVDAMKEACQAFIGTFNFKRYTSKPTAKTICERTIVDAQILPLENGPKNSFYFKVSSTGFLRYQVRLMMGALLDVGRGKWSVKDLKESLENWEGEQIELIAPASGLKLAQLEFTSL